MKKETPAPRQPHPILSAHGELCLDLCLAAMSDPILAKNAFRRALMDVLGCPPDQHFIAHQRAWILSRTAKSLIAADKHKPKTSDSPHILEELNSKTERNPELETQRFQHSFFRLPIEDRILLLLHYRYEVSPAEVSTALGVSEPSLELRRAQALRRLKDQVYGETIEGTQGETSLVQKMIEPPRVSLPEAVVQNPLSKSWIKTVRNEKQASQIARWRRTPWYIRTSIEGFSVALMVLATIIAVPKLRALYEKMTDRRLENYNVAELTPTLDTDEEPAETTEESEAVNEAAQKGPAPDEIVSSGPIKIQEGEIWRFYIKTESPRDMRSKIISLLQTMDLTSSTTDARGKDAPGGIQFDLLVPKENVLNIRQEIEKMAQEILKETGNLNLALNQIYTWYRSKSKKPIPAGRTRIILWLSQI